MLLNQLIAFTNNTEDPAWHGYALAIAIFGGQMIAAMAENQYFHMVMNTGLSLRAGLVTGNVFSRHFSSFNLIIQRYMEKH